MQAWTTSHDDTDSKEGWTMVQDKDKKRKYEKDFPALPRSIFRTQDKTPPPSPKSPPVKRRFLPGNINSIVNRFRFKSGKKKMHLGTLDEIRAVAVARRAKATENKADESSEDENKPKFRRKRYVVTETMRKGKLVKVVTRKSALAKQDVSKPSQDLEDSKKPAAKMDSKPRAKPASKLSHSKCDSDDDVKFVKLIKPIKKIKAPPSPSEYGMH